MSTKSYRILEIQGCGTILSTFFQGCGTILSTFFQGCGTILSTFSLSLLSVFPQEKNSQKKQTIFERNRSYSVTPYTLFCVTHLLVQRNTVILSPITRSTLADNTATVGSNTAAVEQLTTTLLSPQLPSFSTPHVSTPSVCLW